MRTATVRELRNQFPKVERWLQQGEEVQLMKRGRVVGRIIPSAPPVSVAWPDFMARLKETYGEKITSDSQAIVDEGRGDY